MRCSSPWLKASSSLSFSLLQGGDLACQLPNYPLRYVAHHPDPSIHPNYYFARLAQWTQDRLGKRGREAEMPVMKI